MEKKLRERLDKVRDEELAYCLDIRDLLPLTVAVLRAIQAHQAECHPSRGGDAVVLDEAIAVVEDYR